MKELLNELSLSLAQVMTAEFFVFAAISVGVFWFLGLIDDEQLRLLFGFVPME